MHSPTTPHYLRFARALASVATAGLAAASTLGCASSVTPREGDAATTPDAPRAMDIAIVDTVTPPADAPAADTPVVTDVAVADAAMCPPVTPSCPATLPPNSDCRFGGDSHTGCPCIPGVPGMNCTYPDPGPGTCGPLACTCVVSGDSGLGHWSCCSPCVGPLAPPELAA